MYEVIFLSAKRENTMHNRLRLAHGQKRNACHLVSRNPSLLFVMEDLYEDARVSVGMRIEAKTSRFNPGLFEPLALRLEIGIWAAA